MELNLGPRTRRRGFPGGLRAQLLLGLSLLIITTFVLLSATTLQIQRRQLEEASLEQAAQLARYFSELDEETALKVATRLHAGGELGYFAIVDADRTVVYAYPDQSQDPNVSEALEGPAQMRLAGRRHIRAISPLEEPRSGAVVVALPVDTMVQRVEDHRSLFLLYGLLNVLFILLIGYAFFTYLVLRPIRAIGVATERAAGGDLASPIHVRSANEIGHLAQSFNAMLRRLDVNRLTLEERLEALEKAHAELARTQDNLVRSEKLASVGQLAAGVAHEVGNPLAALLGYAELLRDPDTDSQMTREIVERLHPQLERIQTIIRQLLDYSRDDRSEALEPTDLKDCIKEAINLMRAHPAMRQVALNVDVAPDLPTVSALHSAVVQILINLVLNAADAMTAAGTEEAAVTIAAVLCDDPTPGILLTVSDNGPGIPRAIFERIFDPFFTTKEPGHGTGLGLAICLSLMQRFEGDLNIDAGYTRGARFELRFPLTSLEPPASPRAVDSIETVEA